MPRFASSPSLRTHRVRPSEKSAFNAIPGPSPARPSRLRLAIPRRGGLRTPARNPSRQSKRCPFLPPANRTPQVITTCLGSPLARLCGRTECVPPRRSPLASSRGSPARRPTWGLAPSRRGRLRTPARNPSRQSKRCPFLPPANRTPQVITTCLGSPPARLCGRTECVPPRKRLWRHLRAFPAGHRRPPYVPRFTFKRTGLAPSAEGRAPHARKDALAFTPARVH
jgi:hypothetical protein